MNANAPVSIGGDDVRGGSSSANQDNRNEADSDASNKAETNQGAVQAQESSSDCWSGCGGSGQAQYLSQDSTTKQHARSKAKAEQSGTNANAPVKVGHGKKHGKKCKAKKCHGKKSHGKKAHR